MNHDEEIRLARTALATSDQPCRCTHAAGWDCEHHRRDPLDDASYRLRMGIADFHDVIRAAKREGIAARRLEIFRRAVELQGFVQAMVIDARRDLDALKDITA